MKLKKLVHEAKSAALATLLFLGCFFVILALKKLFLAQYDIGFYGLSAAVFGGPGGSGRAARHGRFVTPVPLPFAFQADGWLKVESFRRIDPKEHEQTRG